MSNTLSELKRQVEALDDGHEAKAILQNMLETAAGLPEDSRSLPPLMKRIAELLSISTETDSANAARRKELFTIPAWMVTGSSKIANAFSWWKQNKAFGFVIENGKFSFAPKEVVALPDYSKPDVRNRALRDAPDEEAARAAADAVEAGHKRKQAEAESKAEKARREEEEARAQAAKLSSVKEGLQAELDASEADMHTAQSLADHEAALLSESTETVRLLEGQIGEMNAQKDAAESKTTAMTERTQQMQEQRAQANARVPELEAQLKALQTAYEPVKARMDSAQADYDRAETNLGGVTEQINTLQTQIDGLKSDIATGQEKHDALQAQTAEALDEKERRRAEVSDLLAQMEALREERDVVTASIAEAKTVLNAAKAELMQVETPEDQTQLFLINEGGLAEDGTTGVTELAVRKARNAKRNSAKNVRLEVIAGDLERQRDTACPAGVEFLNQHGIYHPLVGQGDHAEAYMDGDTLVVRVQSAYPKAAKVDTNEGGDKVLLISMEADHSNEGVIAHDFTLQINL